MEEFIDHKIVARNDGYLYEAIHNGWENRGPWEFHKLTQAKLINSQSLVDKNDPSKGMKIDKDDYYPIPGTVYLPVGPTVIHLTHLVEAPEE